MWIRTICAALAVAALAACSAQPGAASLPATSAAVTTSGPKWTYVGTIVEGSNGAMQRGSVTETVVTTNSPDPYATPANVTGYHTTERDGFPGGSVTYRDDAWQGEGPPANGVQPELLYAVREQDSSGDAFWERYPIARIVDRTPESDGATWSNGAGAVYHESDRNGTTLNLDVAADGSYVESVGYPYGCALLPCSLSVTVAPNASATYRGNALAASGITSISIGAPGARGIAIVYTFASGAKRRQTIPSWFMAGAPLYTETDAVHAGVPFPAACHATLFGNVANELVRTIARIDPALGETENERVETFETPGYGTVCAQLQDVRTVRYDVATGQFASRPLLRTVVAETLTLQSLQFGKAHPAIQMHLGRGRVATRS